MPTTTKPELRCRYDDCIEQHPVIPDEEEETARVTCPKCREYLGLPSVEEADDET